MILYLYTLWNDHRKSSYHVLPCMYARQVTSGVSYPLPLWAVALQVPLSMGFPRQEYWEWVAMLSSRGSSQPRDWTLISRASVGGFFTASATWETCATAKSLQSCPTLCDPIDGSPPGSPVPGILQEEHCTTIQSYKQIFLLVMRTFKIHFLGSFQICSTVLLTTVTILHTPPPWLNLFYHWTFLFLDTLSHVTCSPRALFWYQCAGSVILS